ncbi:YlbD family protein [Oceanobacillus sp. FSL K6-2867]|uniref:YlbD family protein n=1 Tax=Oceanobacillus sp. FSL K6-2867 TaxID=2954748 RepID=UPI0030DA8B7C
MGDLHPSVVSFKKFINAHPALIKEIRRSGRSWQEYYEKWALLGEEDPYWDEFKVDKHEENLSEEKSTIKNTELVSQLMKYTSNLDVNKMQGQVEQLSKAVTAIQEIVSQFKKTQNNNQPQKDPFSWVKD